MFYSNLQSCILFVMCLLFSHLTVVVRKSGGPGECENVIMSDSEDGPWALHDILRSVTSQMLTSSLGGGRPRDELWVWVAEDQGEGPPGLQGGIWLLWLEQERNYFCEGREGGSACYLVIVYSLCGHKCPGSAVCDAESRPQSNRCRGSGPHQQNRQRVRCRLGRDKIRLVSTLFRSGTLDFDGFLMLMGEKNRETDIEIHYKDTFRAFSKDDDGVKWK